ncbi:MAG: molybdopterin cofactor-binding domain-containing protein [Lysobacteraceae bacterium]
MNEESQDTIVFPHSPMPRAFIRLNRDNTVTVISKTLEMGQGIHTGHATLVADEIDADPSQMRVEMAPSEAGFQAVYGNVLMGGMQGTGGNTGMQSSYMMYRMAGAGMRQMILAAASKRLGAAPESLRIERGTVIDSASGQRLRFGDIADDVMAEPEPEPADATPKSPDAYTYIGKHFPRVDTDAKIHGREVYPQDVRLPGMLTAVIARPTRLWGKVASFDATQALAFPGVRHVVAVPPYGVAVVAEHFWCACEGRKRLKIEWDDSGSVRLGSADIETILREHLNAPGDDALLRGAAATVFSAAERIVEAEYWVPFHAHAPMETVSCVVLLGENRVELWGGSQVFGFDSINIAQALGVPPDSVVAHNYRLGGSFGRWYGPEATPWLECIATIRALNLSVPLKLCYSREDDLMVTSCFYRPAYAHRMRCALGADGRMLAVEHRIAGQSMLKGTLMAHGMVDERGIDFMSVESSVNIAYAWPDYRVGLHSPEIPYRASPTRFGGTLHNGFSNEVFIDECAQVAGIDPVDYRLLHLPDAARERGCLMLAADRAQWREPLAPGTAGTRRGRGVAVTTSHRSFSACVAEVTVFDDNRWRIDRIVVAIDCGTVINPDNLRSQMEGSVGFSVSLARYAEITFVDGECQQQYYTDYRITRMDTMPRVEAHFVESGQGPSGAGETIGSSVIPAIANALAHATGARVRDLPLRLPGEPEDTGWDIPASLNAFRGAPPVTQPLIAHEPGAPPQVMNEASEFPTLYAALQGLASEANGRRYALATIVGTSGPAFRRTGASMLVADDGEILCTLSGGCPQRDIALRAQQVIANDYAEIVRYGEDSGLDLLMEIGCGGQLEVLIEPLSCASDVAFMATIQDIRRRRTPAAMLTIFAEDGVTLPRPRRMIYASRILWPMTQSTPMDGELLAQAQALEPIRGYTARPAHLIGGLTALIEPIQPPTTLLIIGRNAIAEDLARIALFLGWETILVSMDDTQSTAPPGVTTLQARPDQIASRIRIDPHTAAVVMTFAVERDIDYLQALAGSELFYLGAIASRERAEKMLHRFESRACTLRAPAGLRLGADTPREIALSIAAELIAVIRGGDGSPLHSSRDPIHGA